MQQVQNGSKLEYIRGLLHKKNTATNVHEKLMNKIDDLDILLHQTLIHFPKYEINVLSKDIRSTINELRKLTIVARKRKSKSSTLFDLDTHVELLRRLIRKSFKLKYINDIKLEIISGHISEIGKMVGAWISYVEQKEAKRA